MVSLASAFKFDVVGWVYASTIVAFSDVDLFLSAARSFDVDLSIGVAAVVISVSVVAGWHVNVRANSSRGLKSSGCRVVGLLISYDFYFGLISMMTAVLVMVLLGVDSNVLFAARTAFTILFADSDLFLVVSITTILVAWKRCGEGGVLGFVTFPSDALISLSFYSDLGSCFFNSSVVPVRRRKDAERDRDSGVKVQIDGGRGV